jgi:hypothetical protein
MPLMARARSRFQFKVRSPPREASRETMNADADLPPAGIAQLM